VVVPAGHASIDRVPRHGHHRTERLPVAMHARPIGQWPSRARIEERPRKVHDGEPHGRVAAAVRQHHRVAVQHARRRSRRRSGRIPRAPTRSATSSGSGSAAIRRSGSSRSSRTTPMAYSRIGPTPCVKTSQPAGVSIGEPQLPSWTSSQGRAGAWTVTASRPAMSVVRSRRSRCSPGPSGTARRSGRRSAGETAPCPCSGRLTGELGDGECPEVGGLQQVRRDLRAVERRVGREVGGVASSVKRTNLASSMPWLSAGALGHSTRSDGVVRAELDLVVGRRHPPDPVGQRGGVPRITCCRRARRARRRARRRLKRGGSMLHRNCAFSSSLAELGELLLEEAAVVADGPGERPVSGNRPGGSRNAAAVGSSRIAAVARRWSR
jgi:hypothetical protein